MPGCPRSPIFYLNCVVMITKGQTSCNRYFETSGTDSVPDLSQTTNPVGSRGLDLFF